MSKVRTPDEEKKRRKQELIIILCILPLVGLLSFVETRILDFGADFPLSYTLLMFLIININLLLLLLLIFLVFRNLVKLYYDHRNGVPGAKLRTRLLIAFVTLTLLPTIVLFIFSINFISTSIAFWFNAPVEQALEKALAAGRQFYVQTSENNHFYLIQLAGELDKQTFLAGQKQSKKNVQLLARAADLPVDAIEIYGKDGTVFLSYKNPALHTNIPPISSEKFRDITPDTPTRDVSDTLLSGGEMIRTISAIPYGASEKTLLGYLAIGKRIPAPLIHNLAAITQGASEYQQIKRLKQPVQQLYYLALTVVALLVLFCAIWFAFYLARTITTPIMELAEATRRIAEGDLGFQIVQSGDDEIGILVDSFNRMTRDLQISQEQLSLSARMLRQQNSEIEERRRYIETILKNVSAGVISFNSAGIITTMNPSAEAMLGVSAENLLKKHYKKNVPKNYRKLSDEFEQRIKVMESDIEIPLRLTVSGQPRNFLTHFSALMDDTGKRMGTVMVFDDVTDLEKAQRMAAWREVARRIAHEVKNPLTPLSLSAQRLRRKYKTMLTDPVFDECTRIIVDHVEVIRNLVNAFADYARFPAARLRPDYLGPVVADSVAAFKDMHPQIDFHLDIAEALPRVSLDPQQIQQLIFNLLDNAAAALEAQGKIFVVLFQPKDTSVLRLEIQDNGPGISPEEKMNIFEPYYSTKSSGTGLGLAIVNSIVTEHRATIVIRDNTPSGACFQMDYPIHGMGVG